MKRLYFIPVLLAVSSLLLAPGKALADVNNFTVTDFRGSYYLSKLAPHGALGVDEQIYVNYSDYNHGILRAIPSSYKGHSLDLKMDFVTSPTGAPAHYTTYKSGGNTVLRIGDPNQTVTGPQSYMIDYRLKNVITFFSDHDEFFWDINGDQWGQPFTKISAEIQIPKSLAPNLQDRMLCYVGYFGSTSQGCQISKTTSGRGDANDGSTFVTATAQNLQPYQTLSVVLAFNKGTFAPYTWRDSVTANTGGIVLGGISLTMLGLAFKRWWQKGRDYKGRGVIVPEYGPPKGVSVLDAGILQDYKLDNRDITAVTIDLAIRGYITIVEKDKKTLFLKTGTTTTLTLNNADISKLNDYETQLLQALFNDALTEGTTVTLGKYLSGMQKAITSIGKDSLDRMTKEGFFDTNPGSGSGGWMIIYILMPIITVFISFKISQAKIGATVSFISLIIIIILAAHMPRRSRTGSLYNDDLKGLKLYLKTAEADRIKMLQSPNARYAENAKEPVRSVKLFEKLLPYAIVFGVEKDWAKQFQSLYTQPPAWYQGNWATFNAVVLTDHLTSSTAAFNASFSPPSSSSGSGFSGGGSFSGGGGGGGGGGGW